MEQAYKNLHIKNTLYRFSRQKEALYFQVTTTEQPFLIISEIQFPGMNGIELRQKIEENPWLRRKAMPFVFCTGDLKNEEVQAAYQLQGYSVKKYTLQDMERVLCKMMDYQMECVHQ